MYQIGQFRRTQLPIDRYKITKQGKIESVKSHFKSSNGEADDSFVCENKGLLLEGSNVLDNQTSYYLKFTVYKKTSGEQSFDLILKNSDVSNKETQTIESFVAAKLVEEEKNNKVTFEVIISPNSTYNQIVFDLDRTSIDLKEANQEKEDVVGRVMNIEVNDFYAIHNIIEDLSSNLNYSDLEELAKIGVQGPPGLIMCINREQIRIGRTGIYELNNGMKIQSIGFVLKKSDFYLDGTDYFIMDFQY